MADEATHFCAESFLQNQSTKKIWNRIQDIWSFLYLGPPDLFVIDQGAAYTSENMKEALEAHSVRLGEAPINAPGAIEAVK